MGTGQRRLTARREESDKGPNPNCNHHHAGKHTSGRMGQLPSALEPRLGGQEAPGQATVRPAAEATPAPPRLHAASERVVASRPLHPSAAHLTSSTKVVWNAGSEGASNCRVATIGAVASHRAP